MLIALGSVHAQAAERERARELLLVLQRRVRSQDGCAEYSFAESLEEPGLFLTVQRWRDAAALDAHYRSREFADYQAAVTPLLSRSSELRLFEADDGYTPVGSGPLGAPEVD